MSLILDAINRSQRERANPGEVPGVATVHYAEATVAPGAWRQGLLGLALVVALAVIAWLLLRPAPQGQAVAVPAATPAPVQSSAVSPSTAAPEVTAEAVSPAPRRLPPETDREPVDVPAPAARQVPADVAALYADAASEPAEVATGAAAGSGSTAPAPASATGRESPAGAAETARGATAPADTATEEPVDVEALLARARQEMANDALPDHPAPFLAELSQQRKDAIPTLLYSSHDYRGDEGSPSTVMINGKTARAGQGVGRGVRVEEILPDSVVLAYDGQTFRLRALNSWVNL